MTESFEIQKIRSMMDSGLAGQVRELRPVGAPQVGQADGASEASFSDILKESIDEVNDLKMEAAKATEDLAMGRNGDIQGTIMAVEKAELSFKLMMEVRNKIVSAYQEVMRTSV